MNAEEYWAQGSTRLGALLAEVNGIIGRQPEPRRTSVRTMMDGPIGEQFMTAPASTRRAYHNAFPCGLVDHSLRVVRNALAIAGAVWPDRYPRHVVELAALFHDIGKAGGSGNPFYVPLPEKDAWRSKNGEFWTVSQAEYMPNSERSIHTLLSAGIELSYDEFQAIRLNDGMAPETNRPYAFKEVPLALIVHWGDHASMIEEKELAR